ncbi:UDP-3-O-(3-hydroxymyristoyl)glucosamine N-acyltransferase [Mucilaginibacter sp.]
MQFTAQEISLMLNGTVEGDTAAVISHLAKIEEARPGCLSFLSNPKYEHYLYTTQASVVIINRNLTLNGPVLPALIRVDNAYSAFSVLLEKYSSLKLDKKGQEEPHYIDATATIGNNAYIGAFSYIGANVTMGNNCKIYPNVYVGDNVIIGDNVTLFAGVKIYFDCTLGSNIIVHAGAVIGSDGFGFAPKPNGGYTKIAQIGNVIIEDDVEIGANTTIDRATMGATIIHKGVKLDNLIQIAHNVTIGHDTVMAAQTGIAGSSTIGSNCIIGGQVGIVGHLTVANGTQMQAQTGVNSSIKEPNKKWGGTPVQPYQNFLRSSVVHDRLPELEKKIRELEKIITELRSHPENV